MPSDTLYNKVVLVTATYLGPAADRFVSRHIVNHLNKSPDKLEPRDLKELINWVKPAMGVLTEDREIVDNYIDSLSKLSKNKSRA